MSAVIILLIIQANIVMIKLHWIARASIGSLLP